MHSYTDYDDLPDSAREEINNFIEYVRQKYKKYFFYKKGDIMESDNDLFGLMTKMYSELQNTNKEIYTIHKELKDQTNDLQKQISKNSILLEKVDSNVTLLAEDNESLREQRGRSSSEDKRTNKCY